MLVGVVALLTVNMYVFVILVSFHMEILLTSATPCYLRCSFISFREHDARSGDLITPLRSLGLGEDMFLCLVFQIVSILVFFLIVFDLLFV